MVAGCGSHTKPDAIKHAIVSPARREMARAARAVPRLYARRHAIAGGSDDFFRPEFVQFGVIVSQQLMQYLIRMLTQQRRGIAIADRGRG